jgi:hypothetical protein
MRLHIACKINFPSFPTTSRLDNFFYFTSRRERLWFDDSPARRSGGIMTFSELIEHVRIERVNVAAQLNSLDAALTALTKIATAPAVPKATSGRTWTPAQKAKLSASLKRVFAVKKAGLKQSSKAKG